jgi:diacylglycerol kinase
MSLRRHNFLKSLGFAWSGLRRLVKEERNARIHLVASLAVLIVCFFLPLSSSEWLWILLSISLVWMAELFNSAIERLTDLASPGLHPLAGAAKDFAAAAVLVAALFCLAIAALVLLPHLISFFRG